MKNLLLFFVHFATAICISQNIKIDSDKLFTTNEIDSISSTNGPYISSGGKINSKVESKSKKDRTVINGNGSFTYSLYTLDFNKVNYNKLSNAEQKKYDSDKYLKLIKANYREKINYKNSNSEIINGQFYYLADTLSYVKVKITRSENKKKETSDSLNISISELNKIKVIKTVFLFDYKYWIINKNKDILKIYNKK
ncbi:hypothetical protein [Flavobacterium hydatis]|jgi:hypothetical protein|uniref:Uncharacterized protein n=1 Tax=Flavobacterium hydatis TaxID=991 RepID=A0A086AK77_FLAHY|nr:hypothetical protein [Flavobacterium hydatis]KFF17091.1 hypothetical protein IW20_08765 [Flavobacterium hydatis]OXA95649.1 hypothetical protein B0A62_07840 [Flavobacterium hydatis]